jgi:hypothetical protein
VDEERLPAAEVAESLLWAVLWAVLFGVFLAVIESGPVDYRRVILFVAAGLAVGVPLGLVFLLRRRVGVTWAEVLSVDTPWAEVFRVDGRWTPLGRRVEVATPGRRRLLPAPVGSPFRPDRSFNAAVERIRAYAQSQGARLRPPRQVSRVGATAPVIAPVMIVFLTLGHAAEFGVALPGSASYPPQACDALTRAGLDQVWPQPKLRERIGPQQTVDTGRGSGLRCQWLGKVDDGPARVAQVTFLAMRGTTFTSPVAAAKTVVYDDRVAFREDHPIPALGYDAFTAYEVHDVAEARRADLIIRVDLYDGPGQSRPDQAVLLLHGLVGQVTGG